MTTNHNPPLGGITDHNLDKHLELIADEIENLIERHSTVQISILMAEELKIIPTPLHSEKELLEREIKVLQDRHEGLHHYKTASRDWESGLGRGDNRVKPRLEDYY